MDSTTSQAGSGGESGWLPAAAGPRSNPHMTRAFARAYEQVATRITAPIATAALRTFGPIDRDTRLLDIAAGTGALAIPAAHAGAQVTAIDIAPGMVEILHERLSPFPAAEALMMNGEALAFEDGAFDAVASVIGVSMFPDWKLGLAELARVLRSGGRAAVATWRTPPGGAPFVVMAKALRTLFPDEPPPLPPPGFAILSDPGRLVDAMRSAGLVDVAVTGIEASWEGPSGDAYLDELRNMHPFMGPYAALAETERFRLDDAIVKIVDELSVEGRFAMKTDVLLATASRA